MICLDVLFRVINCPLEPVQRMVRLVTRLHTCDDMSGRVVPGDQLPLWSQSSVWCDL